MWKVYDFIVLHSKSNANFRQTTLQKKHTTFQYTNCAFMQPIFIIPFIQRQHNVIGTVARVNRSILFNPNEMDTNAD